MAKRKAPSSPGPSIAYDSDEITVAPTRNSRQKIQKTSHDESNAPFARRTRHLECVSIPVPTQQELAALQEATTPSAEPPAGLSDNEETELPAYERPLVLDGKRTRKSTYKGLTISDFFPVASHPEELQPQAARGSRPARKSTGQKEDGPRPEAALV
jgi:hypothetical protein